MSCVRANRSRKLFFALLSGVLLLTGHPAWAANGLFPKMPPAATAYVADATNDSGNAHMTAWALEGLINRTSAETYVIARPGDMEQLTASGKPSVRLSSRAGADSGLRTLFGKYSSRVKRMFVYDPGKDWTFYLALMASAQGDGIPVTQQIQSVLASEFGWRGEVLDVRGVAPNRLAGYGWALEHLMPNCTRKVVFVFDRDKPLVDYAVASKGFVFWLDLKKEDELAEAKKIFATNGYTVGTSLMGYANDGDDANRFANPYGIGYVVSDYYANGSFWSSFPDKTYKQKLGKPSEALPGKIYVMLNWSDGDNLSFDQHRTYRLWHDPLRGTIPVGTTIAPSLQELNSPLLDWYYSKLTPKDELISGPSGVQFIFGDFYNADLFPAWCKLSRDWVADAGLHTAIFWSTHYPGDQFKLCSQTMNLAGIIHSDSNHFTNRAKYDLGIPVVDGDKPFRSEQTLFDSLAAITPNPDGPIFVNRDCGVQGFDDDGYVKIQRVVDHLNSAYPGRYVFMLPRDLFATIRAYYHLAPAPLSQGVRP